MFFDARAEGSHRRERASASGSHVERVETRALAERERHLALKRIEVRSAPLAWL
jgi:hypothetical protein